MIKIIFVAKNIFSPRTGGEIVLAKLSDYLKNKGYKLIQMSENDIPQGLRVNRILRNYWFLRVILQKKADIILHLDHDIPSLFLCDFFLKLFVRSKIIVFVGGFVPYGDASLIKDSVRKLQVRLALISAYRIITPSKFSKGEVLSFSRLINKKKVRVIYPYMQDIQIIPHRSNSNKINILHVSNYLPWKGQEYLVGAFSLLENKNTILTLVGEEWDEKYTRRIKLFAKRLGVSERVFFRGRLTGQSLSEAYASADLFVFPSLYESFGMVLLEAMSFGLPMIASNTGGIPEIITDGENGLLVNPRDAHSLKIALEKLIGSKELREKIGREGTDSLKKFPSWEKVCENMVAVVTGGNVPL